MANNIKNRRQPRIQVRWPITIISDQTLIEGESRIVSDAGIFFQCEGKLTQNKTYQVVIGPTPELSIEVKGKLILSNLDRVYRKNTFSGMALSFIKISEEDYELLNNLISVNLEEKNRNS